MAIKLSREAGANRKEQMVQVDLLYLQAWLLWEATLLKVVEMGSRSTSAWMILKDQKTTMARPNQKSLPPTL